GGKALSGRLELAHDALDAERAPHAGTSLACSRSSSTVHWSYASCPYLTAASRPSGAIRKSAGSPKRPPVGLIGPSGPRFVLRLPIAAPSPAIAARSARALSSDVG